MTKPSSEEGSEAALGGPDPPAPPAGDPPPPPPRISSPAPPPSSSLPEADTEKKQQSKFKLRWDSYSHSVLAAFRRLKEEEDFVDVTLACNSKHFNAHKVILSACSPYFRQLLKVKLHNAYFIA